MITQVLEREVAKLVRSIPLKSLDYRALCTLTRYITKNGADAGVFNRRFHISRVEHACRNPGVSDALARMAGKLYSMPPGFGNFGKSDSEKNKEKETKESKKESPNDDKGDKKKLPFNFGGGDGKEPEINWAMLAGMGLVLAGFLASQNQSANEITYQEFIQEFLSKGHVEKIQVVNRSYCRVIVRPESPKAGNKYWFNIGSTDHLEHRLEMYQSGLGLRPQDFIPIQYVNEVSVADEIKSYLPTFIVMGIIFLVLNRLQGAAGGGGPDKFFKMGKAFPAGVKDMKSKVKFTDVAGLKEAKVEIQEFIDFLKDPAKYQKLGARIPKGALLSGPPGTGKTLLAKAVAGEANVPFFSMSGSDFIEVFVGVGPSRVRDLFAQARKHAPSIVFIDEIDAVGRKRGKGGFAGGNDERENTLNQMLVEMDGFTSSSGVVVLAGTNRPDILDPALLRPGRFDRTIHIEKPDIDGRQEIFKVHLKPIKLASSLSVEEISRRLAALTPGFSGADIANICNESAIFAARRNAEGVEMEDFERATERVMAGLAKPNLMGPKEKTVVSHHEAGHALVGWFMEHADPLLKVSIVPRSSGALGFAQYLPEELMLYSKEALLDRIAVTLGGRAAEELFIGKISTGASDDLDKVTNIAKALVSVYGMNSKIGLVSYQQKDDSNPYYKPYSEDTAQVIDAEVKDLINSQYERVKVLLTEKAELLKSLAAVLYEKETIGFRDVEACLGPRPYPMKEEIGKYVRASGQKRQDELDAEKEAEKRKQEELTEPPSAPSGAAPA